MLSLYKVDIMPLDAVDGGGFTAIVPKLPGCRSDGETREEALANAEDAIDCWLEAARELGHQVAQPRQVAE